MTPTTPATPTVPAVPTTPAPPATTPAPPATPKPPAKAVRPSISKAAVRSSKSRKVPVRIKCSAAKGSKSCKATVSLKSGSRKLGSRTLTLKPGRTTAVSVTLSKSAFALLKKRRSLRVTVTLKAPDSTGKVVTTSVRVTLLQPK